MIISSALQSLRSKIENECSSRNIALNALPEEIIHELAKGFADKVLMANQGSKKFTNAEEVRDALDMLYDNAVENCKYSLNDLCPLPNQVAYSMVLEFIDRVLRAEDARYQWSTFLNKHRSLVWVDFEHLEEQEQIRQEWNALVAAAKSVNQRIPSFMTL